MSSRITPTIKKQDDPAPPNPRSPTSPLSGLPTSLEDPPSHPPPNRFRSITQPIKPIIGPRTESSPNLRNSVSSGHQSPFSLSASSPSSTPSPSNPMISKSSPET